MGIIDAAILWAENHTTEVDPNMYYSQTNRYGPYGYDCSSFVTAAYREGGLGDALAWSNTESMYQNFTAAGFEPLDYNANMILQPGDVLFYTKAHGAANNRSDGHAAMYLGQVYGKGNSDQQVHAAGNSYGGIIFQNFNRNNIWQYVLRLKNDTPSSRPYGPLGETPSAWNSGRITTNGTSVDPTNTVVWHPTDGYGGGYYDTSGYGFTPYVVTLAPNVEKVDYVELINARVSAAMFCAGWLYDDYYRGHVPRKEYINPHLNAQVVECQAAGLPYALYAIVRAKNRIEADAECKKLYYVISKYPPQLGLWLYLDMHNSPPSVNEEILDCYYKYITDWGLSSKCGLYLDKSRMHQIDWNKYQYKFYLWLEDHITDQHTLDTINDNVLKSDFFEVE